MYTFCSCTQSLMIIKHVNIRIPKFGAKIRLYYFIMTYPVNALRKYCAA
jgi:hypothetical protein